MVLILMLNKIINMKLVSQLKNLWNNFFGPKKKKVLMVGLDAAGKTSILNWLLGPTESWEQDNS